jgi:glucan phosphoethanolaminetransferase (alkaline phosphatase superfamily)
MYQSFFDILVELVRAWRDGSRRIRLALLVAAVLAIVAFTLLMMVDAYLLAPRARPIASTLFVAASLIVLTIYARQRSLRQAEGEKKIEQVERRYDEHPTEPKAAWDLARVKLELYLNRNLSQVTAIFWLTSFVMIVGFSLIGIGVWLIYRKPSELAPSALAAISGIVVNVIGATFLSIYRATMQQAKDYVTMLERINAVGMSVQILESIDPAKGDLKAGATADLAKQLLTIYGSVSTATKKTSPLRRST